MLKHGSHIEVKNVGLQHKYFLHLKHAINRFLFYLQSPQKNKLHSSHDSIVSELRLGFLNSVLGQFEQLFLSTMQAFFN